jgi:recombination protein RecA
MISREEIMKKTIAEIKKKMPDEIIGRYSEIGSDVKVETISTGSLAVDSVIGGGFPKYRIIDIVGATSSGKTTLALTACAGLLKEMPNANILYSDAEYALDPDYAAALGVDMNKIYLDQPSNGENAFQTIEMFMSSGVADLVVIDSIAAMLPKSLIEGNYDEDTQPGLFAKFISRAIGRLNRLAKQYKCTVILINQWKPVTRMNKYQSVAGAIGGWYQPGGAQLPFFCSQILEIKKSGEIKEGKKVISSITTMTSKKNKIAPPFRSADFVITYGKGIDKCQELIGLGLATGIIKQGGRFYTIPNFVESTFGSRLELGRHLESDKKLQNDLTIAIKPLIEKTKEIKLSSASDEDDEDSENSEFEE